MGNDAIENMCAKEIEIKEIIKPKEIVNYHYTSPSGLMGIIKEDGSAKVFFTQYDSLNDKSEREHAIRLICKACQECIEEETIDRDLFDAIRESLSSKEYFFVFPSETHPGAVTGKFEEYDTYLFSCSANSDSLPMWNYYSKSRHYEGYNIGFRLPTEPTPPDKGYTMDLIKVVYDDSLKREMIKKYVAAVYCVWREGKGADLWLKGWIDGLLNLVLFALKSRHFSHEEEVRMVLRVPQKYRTTGINEVSQRKYRESNGFIVPYVEFHFERAAIRDIHVAPLLESEMAVKNVKDMMAQRNHPDIDVSPSEIPIRF